MSEDDVTLREWTEVIKRARLGKTIKHVAMVAGSYADYDTGERVRPGIARLAIECELAYNTVQGAMQTLESLGLLKLVRRGTSAGNPNTYRLAIPGDLLDVCAVLTPAQVDLFAEQLRRVKRGKYKPPSDTPPSEGTNEPVDEADDVDEQPAAPPAAPDLHPAPRDAASTTRGHLRLVPRDAGSDLHPAPRDAEAEAPETAAPSEAGSETAPAPRLISDLHPVGQAPNVQDPPPNNIHSGVDVRPQPTTAREAGPHEEPNSAEVGDRVPSWRETGRTPAARPNAAYRQALAAAEARRVAATAAAKAREDQALADRHRRAEEAASAVPPAQPEPAAAVPPAAEHAA